MPLTIRFDDQWDPDSVSIRLNLNRPLSQAEQQDLQAVLRAWSDTGIDRGYQGAKFDYMDDKFEWYDGDLGCWMEVYADLGSGYDDPNELKSAFIDLLHRLAGWPQLESIWVGSLYGDWLYPPE